MRRIFSLLARFIFACAIATGGEDGPAIGARPAAPAELARLSICLKDSDVEKACAAARELGQSRHPAAAAILLAFYADGDGERRLAAVKALGMLSVWSTRKKPETLLSIALTDISAAIRRHAAIELAHSEGLDGALKRFIAAAGDFKLHPLSVRNRAIHHAAAVGGLRAADFLRATLSSTETDLAVAAAEELGELRSLPNADALLKALVSAEPEVSCAALAALERLSGNKFRHDLVKWSEWRAALPEDFGKEGQDGGSKPALPQAKTSDYGRDDWPADIVIAFDTTGSFLHVWPAVNQALDAVLREYARSEAAPRIGLIRYRAIDPRATLRYTLQASPMTCNVDAIRKELSVASFGGGSGALHEALRYALNGMVWRERSRKLIVLIGDDSPVSPVEDPMRIVQQLAHDAAVLDGILVTTLYAKTTAGEENRQTYRRIASSGIGRFYEFNKAEQHLVEMSAEKIDVKAAELPSETLRKWLTPRAK